MKSPRPKLDVKTVKRETMSKQVIDQLIHLLMTGQFKPGDKLPTEAELSDMLFVSRAVLREALSSLETMGLIHRKTREGTYFSHKIGSRPFSIMLALSAGDVLSVVEARMAMELGLVSMAAEKITDNQLAVLRDLLGQMSEQPKNYVSTDKEFHRQIALSANNRILEGSIEPLLDMFDETMRQIPLFNRSHSDTLAEHEAILDGLTKRDPVAAYAAMHRHLGHVRDKIVHHLQEQAAKSTKE